MATIPSTFFRDGNRVPITNNGIITTKTITFDGATTDAWGNDGGALDGGVIFTVTGAIRLRLFGLCTTNLAGSGTHAVGISGSTAIYMPAEAAADINADDFVINNATTTAFPILGAESDAAGNFPEYALNGQDIIMTVAGAADLDSGVITYYALWTPFNSDGNLVDAGN
ncbi:hypothetical protein LCGC14_1315290 [marine sediment metagenome]|uniref:Uncharacterized protein n=1 Tax=marine sediment metagenome TaxID=412755 RepID=A0A0F9L6C5_9ZZZZ